MTQIAKVAVAAATYAIDKPYDYLVPSGMELSVGCRVTVPFGRGNRTARGHGASAAAGGACQAPEGHPQPAGSGVGAVGERDTAGPLDAPAVLLHLLRCPAHHPPGGGVVSLPGDLEPLPYGRGGGPYGTGAGGVPDALRWPAGAGDPLHRTGGGYPAGAVSDEKEGTGFRGDGDQPAR